MTTQKGRGRPPKRSAEKKSDYLAIRLDESEKATFRDAANVAGIPLSVWIRERLRSVARRELIDAGRKVPFLATQAEK